MKLMENLTGNDDYRREVLEDEDLLLTRLDLLKRRERILLEAHIRYNLPFYFIAVLCRMSERTVARRIQALIQRLLKDDYVFFLRRRDEFSQMDLEIAYAHFLLGYGHRNIARLLGLSPYKVCRRLRALKAYRNSVRHDRQ